MAPIGDVAARSEDMTLIRIATLTVAALVVSACTGYGVVENKPLSQSDRGTSLFVQ